MQAYSKFIAAFLAFAGVIVSSGLLDGAAQAWASTVLAGIGAALVYLLPNIHKGDGGPEPRSMPYESSN
jgi:hypothetical protein